MPYYDVTTFDGTTIITTDRKQVGVTDRSRAPVIRMGKLDNGATYDADGTADADLTFGTYTVRYRIIGPQSGTTTLNNQTSGLEGLRGKEGTLTGVEYGSAGAATSKTCTARCVDVITESYDTSGPSMHYSVRNVAYVSIVWQLKSYWA